MCMGKFITFEGGDGSGKSTQLAATVEWLRTRGREVVQTFEPGDSPLGCELRRLLLSGEFVPVAEAELLLFLADRAQHVAQVIKPALAEGKWVVCDRYSDSTWAYQLAARKLVGQENQLQHMLDWAELGLKPDMTIWLNLSVDEAANRMRKRQKAGEQANRLDAEKIDFHRAVYDAFLQIQQDNPVRVKTINANQSIADVQSDIQKQLCGL